jgi:phenylacetate-coenzyme A ligase PaaK-like adenylate-forming protein
MEFPKEIFNVKPGDFESLALSVFRFQSEYNPVYSQFINLLGADPDSVESLRQVPFMPAGFFRNHRVVSGAAKPELVFASSGTTGSSTARHYLLSSRLYEESFLRGFRYFYGEPSNYVLLAMLPSYLERDDSSLVYMAGSLIKETGSPASGFYMDNHGDLLDKVEKTRGSDRKIILLGVTHALLALAEKHAPDLSDVIIMETGGMKGMRRELVREELHSILNNAFGTESIHSEYGMTELLSQAYSEGEGLFHTPPWMKVMAGDINDPMSVTDSPGSAGTVNVIDLANFWSCSFIATSDLCRLHDNGTFEVTGRYDNSDIRGCNLLTSS